MKLKLLSLSALALLSSALALSVKHERGTLDLSAPAKRVVALEYSFVDTLLALGVTPVGAALGTQGGDRGAPPYLRARTTKIVTTGSRAQPSLEAIAGLRPQLILADAFVQGELYPQLAKLAPTAAFQSRRGSLEDLNAQTLAIGQLVGREAAAQQLLTRSAGPDSKAKAFSKKGAPRFRGRRGHAQSVHGAHQPSFVGSFLEALGRKNALSPKGRPDPVRAVAGRTGGAQSRRRWCCLPRRTKRPSRRSGRKTRCGKSSARCSADGCTYLTATSGRVAGADLPSR